MEQEEELAEVEAVVVHEVVREEDGAEDVEVLAGNSFGDSARDEL